MAGLKLLLQRGGANLANDTALDAKMPDCPGRRIFVWSHLWNTTNVTRLRVSTGACQYCR